MSPVDRKTVSWAVAQLMPRIIQGVQLEFLVKRTITQTQFVVLVAVYSKKRSTMNALAQSMHVSMPTISGIIDRLVKAGYLKRQESPADRRQVIVELTKKGQLLIEQFQSVISQRWQEVLKSLDSNELESFYGVLTKLKEGLEGGK